MLQFPKMVLVTDQLGNESLGFVNVCLGLIQQSRRSYGNVDLMIFFFQVLVILHMTTLG